jgi:hypothetical protein
VGHDRRQEPGHDLDGDRALEALEPPGDRRARDQQAHYDGQQM